MGQTIEFQASSSSLAREETNDLPLRGVGDTVANKAFPEAVFFLASGMFEAHKTSPRTAALFATQQRWLLSHAALAHFFQPIGDIEPGISRRSLGFLGPILGLSSRNTAYAFFDEALKYGVIEPVDGRAIGHGRLLARPSADSLSLLVLWYDLHFQALDLLDGGQRHTQFSTRWEGLLPLIQPIVANGLFFSHDVRAPGPLFTIFTWADSGGWVMDRLIASVDWQALSQQDRYLTDVTSIGYLARSTGLSNAHTSRKISEAQSIGGLGWIGRPGHSPLWISRSFYEEYSRFQARKLVILDGALTKALTGDVPASQQTDDCA
ncbi:hypothetical protein [Rhizobium hainanense]|uniref:Uncharacterized protein n=1 Tax=Rhizobium hainanense TaxID=52131 RepID=A0A1C3WLF5_9HYPH|nr:hypothetical protein [Rhizobium hainanense]SCB40758.1 hypothetical protein GA0061100_1273 [Rhizobium hainanense]